ncbi:exodeoxyribonuclease VII small subunit [Tamaricihabitans halophyticus]|uniref:Exodeoxyribonuclease 7 small subunit n=1 Tax=Tamaricihabitans halophyticus TaxID=1262583 RepID=A0A4R2R0V1_9PSEU|nr:exodeoxyribonuclease VII small subunit [Tamaricihabitans halophyticus]TCP56282.1 exodeoxyribonuclease VII small subunit [Tamaricihabitans halophyticus]
MSSGNADPTDSAHDNPDSQEGIAELGYEDARDELAEVVRKLEAGGLSLEDSLALWERGEALANACERHLAGARERVDAALAVVTDEADDTDPAQN